MSGGRRVLRRGLWCARRDKAATDEEDGGDDATTDRADGGDQLVEVRRRSSRRAARRRRQDGHGQGRRGRHGRRQALHRRGQRPHRRGPAGPPQGAVGLDGRASSKWCNDQGGIGGLPVEPVDLDGQLLKVEAGDDHGVLADASPWSAAAAPRTTIVFTGKDGSDFHKCKMIAFPGFAVSTDFADANGVVQPLPNPAYAKSTACAEGRREAVPRRGQEVRRRLRRGPAVDPHQQGPDQGDATETVRSYGVRRRHLLRPHEPGLLGHGPEGRRPRAATAVNFVGEPANCLVAPGRAQDQGLQGHHATPTPTSTTRSCSSKGTDAAEGALVRVAVHPFEEADKWPATKQMVDIIEQGRPDRCDAWPRWPSSRSRPTCCSPRRSKDCAPTTTARSTRACVLNAGQEDHTSGTAAACTPPVDPGAQRSRRPAR